MALRNAYLRSVKFRLNTRLCRVTSHPLRYTIFCTPWYKTSAKYTPAVVWKSLYVYITAGMHNNETGDVYKTCKRARIGVIGSRVVCIYNGYTYIYIIYITRGRQRRWSVGHAMMAAAVIMWYFASADKKRHEK